MLRPYVISLDHANRDFIVSWPAVSKLSGMTISSTLTWHFVLSCSNPSSSHGFTKSTPKRVGWDAVAFFRLATTNLGSVSVRSSLHLFPVLLDFEGPAEFQMRVIVVIHKLGDSIVATAC